ncbi:DUF3343 domain-containing protein [Companilactobacillus allii]|uniref:Putative Se/S carrier protein-like domain-containing protein n=1 Tax=Companilactobacillus allii TaxID=1847728 RepID=A0A1P8Q2Z2_9LACO|nr:DUF3343 domain-containing protein [Companilactobacillus allii]APX72201.1 hypothetical protein BTM29_06355 [Companilactobacillus allii]USQ69297.1 DUF3343 domain-containing protein [Companilactobacillus allii]
MKNEFGLVTFKSTHQAIKVKELLDGNEEYKANIISTPGQISAGCGMSLRFNYDKKESLKEMLNDKSLGYQNIYKGTRSIGVRSTYTLDN